MIRSLETLRTSLGYSASSRLELTLTDANGNGLLTDPAMIAPADESRSSPGAP